MTANSDNKAKWQSIKSSLTKTIAHSRAGSSLHSTTTHYHHKLASSETGIYINHNNILSHHELVLIPIPFYLSLPYPRTYTWAGNESNKLPQPIASGLSSCFMLTPENSYFSPMFPAGSPVTKLLCIPAFKMISTNKEARCLRAFLKPQKKVQPGYLKK